MNKLIATLVDLMEKSDFDQTINICTSHQASQSCRGIPCAACPMNTNDSRDTVVNIIKSNSNE